MSRLSEWTLALAMSIVKSIPQEEPVKNYLARLRAHIKPGSKSGKTHNRTSKGPLRHLDDSGFWQAEHVLVVEKYDTLRRKYEEEQNTTFSLNQQIEALQSQAQPPPSGGTPSHSVSKRKRTEGMRQLPKRSKIKDHAVVTAPATSGADFEALGRYNPGMDSSLAIFVFNLSDSQILQSGLKALRSVRELHLMLRGQMYTIDNKVLALHASQTAQALSTVIDNIDVQGRPHKGTSIKDSAWESEITSTNIAVARIFTTVLHSMKSLSLISANDRLVESVVYHGVQFFNSILSTIEAAATAEAKSQLAPQSVKRAVGRPRKGVDTMVESTSTFLIRELTALVRALINHLNTELPCHNQLLEGLLYLLFVRLGQIEHQLAFAGPRSIDVEEQIRNLPPTNDEHQLDPAHRLQRRAMVIEGPFMIDILKKAVHAAPTAFRRRLPEGLSQKYYLTPHALKRLQRTLVDCIFGPGTREDDASVDLLKVPVFSGFEVEMPDVTKHDTKSSDKEEIEADWFEDQLWSVVGWDILGADEDL